MKFGLAQKVLSRDQCYANAVNDATRTRHRRLFLQNYEVLKFTEEQENDER